jgi:UDP-glucose:(heptosyl)LPS alpha-1,3-glucosyltransferase
MDIGIAIFRLVPTGGLESDAIRTAATLLARGHRVTLYASAGTDAAPAGVETVRLDSSGSSNHAAMAAFSAQLDAAARGRHDLLVGFKKLQGLDLLYCADWCYAEDHAWYEKLLPRYRTMAALERACFAADSKTRILLLSEPQRKAYAAVYHTPAERMSVLPPTLDPKHNVPAAPTAEERALLRTQHGLAADSLVWLWVGLQPHVKGLDRVIAALARHPRAVLLICGASSEHRRVAALLAQARRHGIADRIRVLGTVTDELKALYGMSDLLVHPARLDVTGTVILEAMAHGLPVITTAICGYSAHVSAADAGVVLPMPFHQPALERALAEADPERRRRWSRNAFAYCDDPKFYSGIDRACDLIEIAGRQQKG